MPTEAGLPEKATRNIALIAEIERQLQRKQTRLERASAVISGGFGSLYFVVLQAVFVAGWVWINSGPGGPIAPFDPPPFPILALTLSITFFFLTVFVLINQRHQMRQAERWAHLDLQLSILMEQEVTRSMNLLVSLCRRFDLDVLAADRELIELAQQTSVSAVAAELERARDEKAPRTDQG